MVMRLGTVLLVLAAIVCGKLMSVEDRFTRWVSEHGKSYQNSGARAHALAAFRETLTRITKLSSASPHTQFGLNQFSDLTPNEFRQRYLGFRPLSAQEIASIVPPAVAAPSSLDVTFIDWRTKGAVSPVKDQGQCGSCWAFSVTEATESQWFLTAHPMPLLSPQQIVDCDDDITDQGCNGGTPQGAYEYLIDGGGLQSEESYPYVSGHTGQRGDCVFNRSAVVVQMREFTYATDLCIDVQCDDQDERAMQDSMVNMGPPSICVNSSPFQDYVGGVLMGADCPHSLLDQNHCIQLVGFNSSATPPYYIARNSWGPSWGLQGYIYLEMGQNTCGVANCATFPIV